MARVRTEDKTEVILDAALRRFLHYGLKKTSMQEVAKDAGVGVGTLYLYFKDKDALVEGCAERFAQEHRAEAEVLLGSRQRADKKLEEYLLHRYRVWQKVGLRAPGALELAEAILRLRPEKVTEGADDLFRNIKAILAEGRASGVFSRVNPEREARVLMLSLMGFFPVAGREPPIRLGEKEFLVVLEWFVQRFKEGAVAKLSGAKGVRAVSGVKGMRAVSGVKGAKGVRAVSGARAAALAKASKGLGRPRAATLAKASKGLGRRSAARTKRR